MTRKTLLLLFLSVSIASVHGRNNRIGVLTSKISTLVFKEDVIDTEVGSPDYFIKVKGRYLLIRAKHNRVAPTSLFVRYGKHKDHYITEIFPYDQAPLKYHIGKEPIEKINTVNDLSVFSTHKGQQAYYTLGVRKNGITVILTDIIQADDTTHLRIFIDNKSSIKLCLSHWAFEYITIHKKFFFLSGKKRRKRVLPISIPDNVQVPPQCGEYIEYAIPTHVSKEGLEIFLSEQDGEREFRFLVPKKVLLKAKRK